VGAFDQLKATSEFSSEWAKLNPDKKREKPSNK
jgi:hypothetical protein